VLNGSPHKAGAEGTSQKRVKAFGTQYLSKVVTFKSFMSTDDRPSSAETFKAFAIAEGILLIILGLLALIFPVLASVWVTGVIAVVFLVGGVVGWISNLARSRQMGRWICFWRLVVSTLFIVAGASMISNFRSPADAAEQVAALSLAIGIVFLVEGVVAFFNGLSHSNRAGSGWAIANGVITFILGLLIVTLKFWGLLWVLGMLVGISFLFSGIDLIALSSTIHKDQDPPAAA
jgi:uncharacterized membrane protein HdeD (DUF308 family)